MSNHGPWGISMTLFISSVTPRVDITPKDQIVLRNTPFSLSCNASANPAWTSIKWYRDDVEISTSQELTEQTGIRTDSLYKCVVTNIRGDSDATTPVIVHCELQ